MSSKVKLIIELPKMTYKFIKDGYWAGDSEIVHRAISNGTLISDKDTMMEWIKIHPLQSDDGGAYICSKCHSGDYGCEKDAFCRWCGRKARK